MGLLSALGGAAGFLLGGPTGAKIGATLGGGLDSSRNAKRSRKNALSDNGKQWIRHRKASIAGGFNPLTTMGMYSGQTGLPSGVPSAVSTQAMVGGFVDAANSYAFNKDPIRDLERERLELGNDLARLEIEKLSDIPSFARSAAVGNNVSVAPSPVVSTDSGPPDLTDPLSESVQPGPRTSTSVSDLDADWFSMPLTLDAAGWAERYGEPGEIPGAIHTAMSDLEYNQKITEFASNSKWSKAEVHQQVLDGNGYVMDQIFRKRRTWDTERQPASVGDYNAGGGWSQFGGDPGYYPQSGQDPQSYR